MPHKGVADEQNMFGATVADALTTEAKTQVDRMPDTVSNGDDGLDRMHVHLGARTEGPIAVVQFIRTFAGTLVQALRY